MEPAEVSAEPSLVPLTAAADSIDDEDEEHDEPSFVSPTAAVDSNMVAELDDNDDELSLVPPRFEHETPAQTESYELLM